MIGKPTRLLLASLSILMSSGAWADFTATPSEARAIAKEAYLYGYPVVQMYKTLYTQAVDKGGANFKAPFNRIANTTPVVTPKETALVTPNLDTPYSFVWMDLRSEPLVLTLPKIEEDRYYSVQLIDLYTQNIAYLGTRSTGNNGGHYMIAGPDWKGQQPVDVDRVVYSESNIAYALYRTQLFDEKDLGKVKQIQNGYKVQPLSSYVKQAAPAKAPKVEWPKPTATMTEGPQLFRYLNFMLAFAAPQDSEKDLLARFAKIGIAPGAAFKLNQLTGEQRKALEDGISDARAEFAAFKKNKIDTNQVPVGDLFGSRDHLQNNYLYRYAGADMRIFGNSSDEAAHLTYSLDSEGKPANGARHSYTVHFAKDQLPPADAFWSLTMYNAKTRQLVPNHKKRYQITSRMLPDLKRDADGGVTLALQHHEPEKAEQSNWLPAPTGPFVAVLRIYLPKPEVASGQWKLPPLTPLK
ncbi:cell envelope protein [Pseudomonas fluorescens ABAC62]|nr:cell envelope protein [Pseudomonas fluorescens ABAC62]